MNEEKSTYGAQEDERKNGLNKRIEGIGWALFLIMIGLLMLVPEESIPESTWLIGAGLILLGVNGARRLNGIKMEVFTIILGIIALACGISGFMGVSIPVFPILLILFGANIILKPIIKKALEEKEQQKAE